MPPHLAKLLALSLLLGLPLPAQEEARAASPLVTAIRDLMEVNDTPGLALAIVRRDGDDIVTGLGRRDAGSESRVDARTRFAIGSSTKAFTALGLALHVDAGRAAWSDPVRAHLPAFRLAEPQADQGITLEDLLCHRSGLPRHDLTWYGAEHSREELIAALAHLEASAPFRAEWQYQNLMFVVAGHLAGRLADSDWETHTRDAILVPLGMSDTLLHISEMADGRNVARGHQRQEEAIVPRDYRTLGAVGPAGSICSTAADLARWLDFWLEMGANQEPPLVSRAVLKDLGRPRIAMPPLQRIPGLSQLQYGLGWMVGTYRGHDVIFHGGDIDGFTAQVAFFPGEGFGVAAVSNLEGDVVPRYAPFVVADRLLELEEGKWSARVRLAGMRARMIRKSLTGHVADGARPLTLASGPLDDFAGHYDHPAYGRLEIHRAEDGLHVAFHGQDSPLVHYHHDVFLARDMRPHSARLHFRRGLLGAVETVEVPFEPMAAPIVFTRRFDPRLRDPAVRAEIVGKWRILLQPVRLEEGRDGGFVLQLPGERRHRLLPGPGRTLLYEGLPNHRVEVRFGPGGDLEVWFHEPARSHRARR